ncbi:MAG: sulfatase/phosphatase domain-containing protein, partial [Alphaproteobacteria bacterium]
GVPEGRVCATPTSLVDAFPAIVESAGLGLQADKTLPGRSWFELANQADDPDRIVFSEYHAARSPSASYMIRKGRFKYIHYVGFDPELFDLETDGEETTNLAKDPEYATILAEYESCLRDIVDPDAVDRQANDAQKMLVLSRGGPEAVYANLVTSKHYTPAPGEAET